MTVILATPAVRARRSKRGIRILTNPHSALHCSCNALCTPRFQQLILNVHLDPVIGALIWHHRRGNDLDKAVEALVAETEAAAANLQVTGKRANRR